jgi:hypothetical protein
MPYYANQRNAKWRNWQGTKKDFIYADWRNAKWRNACDPTFESEIGFASAWEAVRRFHIPEPSF